jgi:hypothetical protein
MMRALTLIRPWCWAILHAGKDVENRSWPPMERLLGSRIAIHSGMKYDDGAAGAIDGLTELGSAPRNEEWPGGHIVGTVRVDGWVESIGEVFDWQGIARSEAVKAARSPWFVGPIAWVLRDPVALAERVPCRGAQGLWTLPADVEERVRAQGGG